MTKYNGSTYKIDGSLNSHESRTFVSATCPSCLNDRALRYGVTDVAGCQTFELRCTECGAPVPHDATDTSAQRPVPDGGATVNRATGEIETDDAADTDDVEQVLAQLRTGDVWLAIDSRHGTEFVRFNRDGERWESHLDHKDPRQTRPVIGLQQRDVVRRVREKRWSVVRPDNAGPQFEEAA